MEINKTMATIGTRINENGEEEIIITDINNDLNGLIDEINKFRKEFVFSGKKIFVTEDLFSYGETIDKDIDFSNCIFEKKIGLFSCIFKGIVNFNRSKFQSESFFHNISFQNKTNFFETNFQKIVNFYKVIFRNEVYFSGANFIRSINFTDTIFYKIVSFSYATFRTPQSFIGANFLDSANFLGTIFEQEAQFTSCKVDSKTLISFQCATFKKGLDISTSNFNLCKLNFLGIRIENINEALSSGFYNIKDKNNLQYLSPHQRLRETFRFIKNSLYAENNQIEGLEFHKKEMEVYEKELESKGDEYWQDKIMLWLNKMSNNYGTSWLRGVGFTAVWALGILGIILGITTLENSGIIFNLCDVDAWKHTIKAYIEVINIAKWTDIKPLGYELSGFGLFFLFIGRIFIGYGYYQTIQAFRKYGK